MNTLTAFADASHTYGSSGEESRRLRQGRGGLLKVSRRRVEPRPCEAAAERLVRDAQGKKEMVQLNSD